MYIQILDQSNIKLYDMVKNMGGNLIARKVDYAVIHYPNGNAPDDDEFEVSEYDEELYDSEDF